MKFQPLNRLSVLLLILTFVGNTIAQDLKQIDKYIENARKTYNVPGMSVAIVKDGKIFLNKGYGTLEEGEKQKVDENTLFAIASNTKAFVASAIATLVSEGKLSWNDKVIDHLPYFQLYDNYVTQEMTIRDLLCHRAGLGTFSGDAIWYKSELPAEEVVKLARYVPKAYDFRGGYGYTNLMFITAGEVISKVSGQPWTAYLKSTFFDPIDMGRTITSTNNLSAKGNFATPHKTQMDKNKAIDWTNWDNMGAAGGIISSSSDMAKWMILQLNKGVHKGDTLLEPVQQNLLWTPHNNHVLSEGSKRRIPGRNFSGYGLGWGLQDYYGRKMVSHGGGYDGMYSRLVMLPEENLGVVILTNSMSGISPNLAYYVINEFIKEDQRDWIKEFYRPQSVDSRKIAMRKAHVLNTEPSLSQEKYAGDYYANMYGDIQVKNENGKLRLLFSHSPLLSATLEHWHYNTFEIKWDQEHAWFDFGLATFTLDDTMKVEGIKLNVPNYDIFFDEYEIYRK